MLGDIWYDDTSCTFPIVKSFVELNLDVKKVFLQVFLFHQLAS